MRLEWIEDLLTLIECKSFSQASSKRSLSQPAFSRRIQALEEWFGVQLVDRSKHPVCLTKVAEDYQGELRRLQHDVFLLKAKMLTEVQQNIKLILYAQHSITMTRLPLLLRSINNLDASIKVELVIRSENREDCILSFLSGEADLLVCLEDYYESLLGILKDIVYVDLGKEDLVPVSGVDAEGNSLFGIEGQEIIKVLSVPSQSHMGNLIKPVLDKLMKSYTVEIVHESVFLAGVREMVKVGLGIAWLPESLIDEDLENRLLKDLTEEFCRIPMRLVVYGHNKGPKSEAIKYICEILQTVILKEAR